VEWTILGLPEIWITPSGMDNIGATWGVDHPQWNGQYWGYLGCGSPSVEWTMLGGSLRCGSPPVEWTILGAAAMHAFGHGSLTSFVVVTVDLLQVVESVLHTLPLAHTV